MTETNKFIDAIDKRFRNNISVSNAIANLSEENRAFILSFMEFDKLTEILKSNKTAKQYNKNIYEQGQATVRFYGKAIEIIDEMSNYLFRGKSKTNEP